MSEKMMITYEQFDTMHGKVDHRLTVKELREMLAAAGVEVEPVPINPVKLRAALDRIVSREVKALVDDGLGDVFTVSEIMSMFDEAVRAAE
jgi:hypothetical protein